MSRSGGSAADVFEAACAAGLGALDDASLLLLLRGMRREVRPAAEASAASAPAAAARGVVGRSGRGEPAIAASTCHVRRSPMPSARCRASLVRTRMRCSGRCATPTTVPGRRRCTRSSMAATTGIRACTCTGRWRGCCVCSRTCRSAPRSSSASSAAFAPRTSARERSHLQAEPGFRAALRLGLAAAAADGARGARARRCRRRGDWAAALEPIGDAAAAALDRVPGAGRPTRSAPAPMPTAPSR